MLKNLRVLVVYVLFGCSALAGCGTKGPLYIPEQRYPQKETSQKPTPQDEAPKAAPKTNTDATPQPAE